MKFKFAPLQSFLFTSIFLFATLYTQCQNRHFTGTVRDTKGQLITGENIDANKVITYESIAGQPVVSAETINTYYLKTRDFSLNYNYKKPGITDTLYHVTSKLIFRNKIRDKVNETRDYLNFGH